VPTLSRMPITSWPLAAMKLLPALKAPGTASCETPAKEFPVTVEWASWRCPASM
jgi:hypothetical protein